MFVDKPISADQKDTQISTAQDLRRSAENDETSMDNFRMSLNRNTELFIANVIKIVTIQTTHLRPTIILWGNGELGAENGMRMRNTVKGNSVPSGWIVYALISLLFQRYR